jgi:ribonuclease HII
VESRRGAQSGEDPLPNVNEELAAYDAGFGCVAGVDEAGRGAWAGPLVAAAVILPVLRDGVPLALDGVTDSKLLSASRREELAGRILACAAAAAAGAASAAEVDLLGVTAANELAMVRAVRGLSVAPDLLLVDAFRLRSMDIPQRPLIRGDRRCLSIAAASIIAKVTRDRHMTELADRYSAYGFDRHKGYGVASHRRALERAGICELHRVSYAPIAALLDARSS